MKRIETKRGDFSGFSAPLHPAFTLAGLDAINQPLTEVVTDRLSEFPNEVIFNHELIAQGAANIVCPFFGAPPGVAAPARTLASARAVVVGLRLIDWKRFRDLPRTGRSDAALFLLRFRVVVFSDLIVGAGVGSLIAMLLFVERPAQPTRLEPVVPDPAKKEPSAIALSPGPAYSFGEQRLKASINNQIFRASDPEARSNSNSFQASEENNHDQPTAFRPM